MSPATAASYALTVIDRSGRSVSGWPGFEYLPAAGSLRASAYRSSSPTGVPISAGSLLDRLPRNPGTDVVGAALRDAPLSLESRSTQMKAMEQRAARISATEVLSLWQEYKRTGDLRLRDRLIFTFTPMVRYIVYRKVREVPAQCDVEDFLSCGLEALIHSIERYDPAKGATLEQFAWTRIHGAVLDELRRHDWAPRSLRRAERAINGARESFASEHERRPQPRGARRRRRHEPHRAGWPPRRARARGGRLAQQDDPLRGLLHDRADRHARERGRGLPTPRSAPSARRPRSAFAPPSPSCPRASARSRCCCMWRGARCATSARGSASPRAASRRSTPSCAAACASGSPATSRCSPQSDAPGSRARAGTGSGAASGSDWRRSRTGSRRVLRRIPGAA